MSIRSFTAEHPVKTGFVASLALSVPLAAAGTTLLVPGFLGVCAWAAGKLWDENSTKLMPEFKQGPVRSRILYGMAAGFVCAAVAGGVKTRLYSYDRADTAPIANQTSSLPLRPIPPDDCKGWWRLCHLYTPSGP